MSIDRILELVDELEADNANRSGATRWAIANLRATAETVKKRLEGAGDEPYVNPKDDGTMSDISRAARATANREAWAARQAEVRAQRDEERRAAGWVDGKRWEPYELEAAAKLGFDSPAQWRTWITEVNAAGSPRTPEAAAAWRAAR